MEYRCAYELRHHFHNFTLFRLYGRDYMSSECSRYMLSGQVCYFSHPGQSLWQWSGCAVRKMQCAQTETMPCCGIRPAPRAQMQGEIRNARNSFTVQVDGTELNFAFWTCFCAPEAQKVDPRAEKLRGDLGDTRLTSNGKVDRQESDNQNGVNVSCIMQGATRFNWSPWNYNFGRHVRILVPKST
jgi:hypothetical protein